MRMPFGRHKEEPVEDLPTSYITWILLNCEHLDPGLVEELENQIQLRDGKGVER